ncbi:hypothetical protein M8C21_022985 [Ambrosia artemisiifolia]|uniref:Uncharacterized protein n=1 Tax=Ambrosia artemisiifolia TaxID=4212 RepID=A0AAD5C8L9_AMBAR|nr:hypothetical protein M8C21_022980 [Ambrosia artemisiifolia]KAI7737252.1 hypothetical protein M8C21_022985 [Ambrosia artemisiifolia]
MDSHSHSHSHSNFLVFSLIIITLLFISSSQATASKHSIPIITVVGVVYCDACHNNSFSTHSYFLPGAEVRIDCKFKAASPRTAEQITFSVNRTTNRNGVYKLDIPSVDGINCAKEAAVVNTCRASLIRSTSAACNVPAVTVTSNEFSVKSREANLCIYTMYPLSFRPSKKDLAICGK